MTAASGGVDDKLVRLDCDIWELFFSRRGGWAAGDTVEE